MLRLFRHLKGSYRYIVCIVLLLLLQANCDLALPSYTSNIVNVGIQQKGIEDGVPEEIREETMEHLLLFMETEEGETIKNNYELEDGLWKLKKITSRERKELAELLSVPEMIVTGLSGEDGEAQRVRKDMGLPADADLFAVFGQIPKEQLLAQMEEQTEKLEEMPDTMVTQSAVLFVQQEYEAQGKDSNISPEQLHFFGGGSDAGACPDHYDRGNSGHISFLQAGGSSGKRTAQ